MSHLSLFRRELYSMPNTGLAASLRVRQVI
jgi:hypothetical protein